MTHSSSHIIIEVADQMKDLADRLEHLTDEQREKVLKIVEKARKDLAKVED